MTGKQKKLTHIPVAGLRLVAVLLVLFSSVPVAACLPQVSWGDTISFCSGNSVTLNAFNQNASYVWSTGATSSSITVTSSGEYWVKVTNSCGSTLDTVQILVANPVWVNLGSNRILCGNGSMVLNAPYEASSSYLWQDGSTADSLVVNSAGTYWVVVNNACGTFTDSVTISQASAPSVNLGNDINLCQPGTQVLQPQSPVQGDYLWSTGALTSQISVNQPGTYWLKVTNDCGTDTDSIKFSIEQGKNLDIGDTVYACPNGTVILESNLTGGSYLWSTNATTRTITVGLQGSYWLEYTDNCGTYYDTAHVVYGGKASVNLGPDTTVCNNYRLNAGNPGSSYLWQNGSTSRTLRVQQSGTYWVGVDNGCGRVYDTVQVTVSLLPQPRIPDTIHFCQGSSVVVNAGVPAPGESYTWPDNSTAQTKTYSKEGWQWVDIHSPCGTVRDSFYLEKQFPLNPDLGPDTIVCGNNFQLSTGLSGGGIGHKWNGSSGGSNYIVSQSGTYLVEVTNECGTYTDSIEVELIKRTGLIGSSTRTFCQGGSLKLEGASPLHSKFQWSTGDTTSSIVVSQPGTYWLHTYNQCDTIVDTIDVEEVYPLQINLGNDTTVCRPDIVLLDVSQHKPDSVRWSTNSHNGVLPVTKTGRYWVEVYNACGMYSDTIHITVKGSPKKLLDPTYYCTGSGTTLSVQQPDVNSYLWNNGSTTASISISQPGWYYVTMMNECDTVVDSAFVHEDQPITGFDLGNDTIFCAGTLLLTPPQGRGLNYRWQDGSRDSTFLVTKTGQYQVTVSNSCNTVTDSINVLITGPPKFVLGNQVKLCNGTILNLNARNPGSTYLWNTGDSSQLLAVDTAGTYWVTITNNCGQLTDTVEVIVEYSLADFSLGNDTSICKGQQLVLDPAVGQVNFQWSNGSTDPTLSVSNPGTYWVRVRNSCGRWYDTIDVQVIDVPTFELGNDRGICALEGNVTLRGPTGMDSYLWSNGDTTPTTTFYNEGKKWLTVWNRCFNYTDTVVLFEEHPIDLDLGPDTLFCFGERYNLNPGITDYTVIWDDGSRGPTREITGSGTYWASTSNSCGTFYDTVAVGFHRPIVEETLDTNICDGDSLEIDLSQPGHSFLWFDGLQSPQRIIAEEGRYPYTVTNKCGSFRRALDVNFSNCKCPVYVPNAFTPNGDGVNDFFAPVFDCDVREYHLQIFDRWGQQVFSTNDHSRMWNGENRQQQELKIGTYNYRLYYAFEIYGSKVQKEVRGVVNILR